MFKPLQYSITVFLLLLFAGCKESSTGTEPDIDTETGTAQIHITTSGEDKGTNPYLLLINETTEEELTRPDEVTAEDIWEEALSLELDRGSHEIELSALAPNCIVEEENPVAISIQAGQKTDVEFTVVCSAALNNKVVFVSDRDGPTDLYVADPGESRGEGFTNYTRLTNDDYLESNPAVSSDGTKITYVQSGNIWVINADGTNPKKLTESRLDNEPTWFAGNTKIAFSSMRDEISQIYVMNADGSGLTRLATDQAMSKPMDRTTPLIWQGKSKTVIKNDEDKSSPKLMTAMGRGDDSEIVVLDLDDDGDGISEINPVTDNNHFDGYPALSPDGSELLVVVEDGEGTKNLRLIDAENGETLSTSDFEPGFIDDQAYPGWAPDGTEILFTSVNTGKTKAAGSSVMAQDYNAARSNKPTSGIEIDTDRTDFNVMHAVWSPAW